MIYVSCMSDRLKQSIQAEASSGRLSNGTVQVLIAELDKLAVCPDGAPIGFAKMKATKVIKQKRPPTEYQVFVGQCMKEKKVKSFGEAPAAMKECAAAWKVKKAAVAK